LRLSKQQKQTKSYFEKISNQWHIKANLHSDKVVNVINQRNEYVKKIALRYLSNKDKVLDVGCGSGELVVDLIKLGYDAQGIDFSKSMIKKAKEHAMKNHVDKNTFIEGSIFEHVFDREYDLISANGFIEYISEKELTEFLKKSQGLLSKNGIIVVGSRNRLFNVYSFNKYTKDEIDAGNLDDLVEECMHFNLRKNFQGIIKNKVKSKIRTNLKKHSKTGVDVDTRFQYTPFQLFEKLEKNGFRAFDISPIHIHVFTTETRKIHSDFHNGVSNYMQSQNDNIGLIPQSSSFMISAKRS